MTPNQLIAAAALDITVEVTVCTHNLTVVFMDGRTEVLPGIESSRIEDGVLRLRCRDAGKHSVYSLPLANIRMWHRELT